METLREEGLTVHVRAEREADLVVNGTGEDSGTCQSRVQVERNVNVDVSLPKSPAQRLPVLLNPETPTGKVLSADGVANKLERTNGSGTTWSLAAEYICSSPSASMMIPPSRRCQHSRAMRFG